MDRIRIAGVAGESVVDGPGIRYVVFCQGCPHRCPGCHNPETWDPMGGYEAEIGELVDGIRKNPLLKGVTLTGGDPFMQAAPAAKLARAVKEMGKDVIVYTGYTWEQLLERVEKDNGVRALLENADIIVDGPFIKEQRDLRLVFRGSSNQRVIDVRSSLAAGKPVLVQWG
ncbi:MAG: anaerobic ribonucleoside-triphosphate reductase activating protein [Bacillota bacterium]